MELQRQYSLWGLGSKSEIFTMPDAMNCLQGPCVYFLVMNKPCSDQESFFGLVIPLQ